VKPIYFDLSVADLAKARRFFEEALGWKFERFAMPYEYYRITAGPTGEAGIDGGIGQLADAGQATDLPMVNLVIPVPDLDSVVEKVASCGGTVVEPRTPIPGIGWMATCAEPGGLRFGLMEADSSANLQDTAIGERM
jgi:predicted enzyme related to lactoylglutathione lyase